MQHSECMQSIAQPFTFCSRWRASDAGSGGRKGTTFQREQTESALLSLFVSLHLCMSLFVSYCVSRCCSAYLFVSPLFPRMCPRLFHYSSSVIDSSASDVLCLSSCVFILYFVSHILCFEYALIHLHKCVSLFVHVTDISISYMYILFSFSISLESTSLSLDFIVKM